MNQEGGHVPQRRDELAKGTSSETDSKEPDCIKKEPGIEETDKTDKEVETTGDNNMIDEDTLKDTFWRDLEMGRIQLGGDMYSNVKGRRAALQAKQLERKKQEENRKKAASARKKKIKSEEDEEEDGLAKPKKKRKIKMKRKTSAAALDAFETLESATKRTLDLSMSSPEPALISQRSMSSISSSSYSPTEEAVTVATLEKYHSSGMLNSTDDESLHTDASGDSYMHHFLECGTGSNSRPPGMTECTLRIKEEPQESTTDCSSNWKLFGDVLGKRQVIETQQTTMHDNKELHGDNATTMTDKSATFFGINVGKNIENKDKQITLENTNTVLPPDISSSEKLFLSIGRENKKIGRSTSEDNSIKLKTILKDIPDGKEKSEKNKRHQNVLKELESDSDVVINVAEERNKDVEEWRKDANDDKIKTVVDEKRNDYEENRKDGHDKEDKNRNKKTKCSSYASESDVDSLLEFDLDEYDPNENVEEEFDFPSEITQEMFKQAVKDGNYRLVNHALRTKRQYNLHETESSGMTLVMLACSGQHDEILKLLVTSGAPVNAKQMNGTTALMMAAESGYTSTVAILLEAGAHANQQQSAGETALMKACKKGHRMILRLLLENGADPTLSSTHGNTSLHFAKMYSQPVIQDLLNAHTTRINKAVESAVLRYLAGCARILKPLFPNRIFPVCESTDHSVTFTIKSPQILQQQGVGTLLFLIHAGFSGQSINCKLTGPCCVKEVQLNNIQQQQVIQGSNFVISLCTKPGLNLLHINTIPLPNSPCKLLVCGYILQLTSSA
uniref:M-phase phosphoprotein 8-like isoform X2 n=1 Tax=Saccoglossus kowalevskii TaxID=10224 RepID=A0ABM0MS78_SACKO|nr:PREDICTED: M-phase phosphoprotein 8-like isoform X2 [Saccoglossus kowalevskii]